MAEFAELAAPVGAESTPSLARTTVDARRVKLPDATLPLATLDGADVDSAMVWPGVDGIGKPEYVFTAPPSRGRGVPTTLIGASIATSGRRPPGRAVSLTLPDLAIRSATIDGVLAGAYAPHP